MENDTQNTDSPHWQTVEPSGLPPDYDPTFTDEERIAFLENKCLDLTEQVDRQAAVIVAVRKWEAWDKPATRNALRAALAKYDVAMAELAKGGTR